MTAITTKPGQKRLDRCVLKAPKWAEIIVNRECDGQETAITTTRAADPTVSLENEHKIHHHPSEPTSLGKCPFIRNRPYLDREIVHWKKSRRSYDDNFL